MSLAQRYLAGPTVEAQVADMIFEFLDDSEVSSGSSCNSSDHNNNRETEEDETDGDQEENKLFWESQEQDLAECLFRTSTIESKIRQATREIVKEIKGVAVCGCGSATMAVDGCRRCFQRVISDRLQHAGYSCGICKAKWMNLKQIPAGEHTYIEVLDNSNSKKGVTRVIIELNLRTEFEMAKGSQEYNHLISRLPELYVGKTERLESLIKILCLASKRCMKDQKMHIAPWRKLKYMQAKWHGVRESESGLSPDILPIVERSRRLSRPMVSLLTFDLVENLSMSSSLHKWQLITEAC
ncbi:hypothetical protein HanRHA438_Chr17g0820241 [Helianthus annuus]|nr:hypothetical protein HanHA89_Chr17g0712481 [Helianthus annuus]KAJ0632948.1 hypothetical protein HanLR1_Chr17g0671001 [Helianthus annuus]KAJ0813774.1 hypothetical protein HanPSC8_Chr17g0777511 [Helianthus annuus]KAJ0826958.1 hypothetical protein HanRHA438_Chr17g0820241 [Helianthus annuus]